MDMATSSDPTPAQVVVTSGMANLAVSNDNSSISEETPNQLTAEKLEDILLKFRDFVMKNKEFIRGNPKLASMMTKISMDLYQVDWEPLFRSQIIIVDENDPDSAKAANLNELFPRADYYKGVYDSRDVRYYLMEIELLVNSSGSKISNSNLLYLLRSTMDHAVALRVRSMAVAQTYEAYIDTLLELYSSRYDWDIAIFSDLTSAKNPAQLVEKMKVLTYATSKISFSDVAKQLDKTFMSTTSPAEWRYWKDLGNDLPLHLAYEKFLQNKPVPNTIFNRGSLVFNL